MSARKELALLIAERVKSLLDQALASGELNARTVRSEDGPYIKLEEVSLDLGGGVKVGLTLITDPDKKAGGV